MSLSGLREVSVCCQEIAQGEVCIIDDAGTIHRKNTHIAGDEVYEFKAARDLHVGETFEVTPQLGLPVELGSDVVEYTLESDLAKRLRKSDLALEQAMYRRVDSSSQEKEAVAVLLMRGREVLAYFGSKAGCDNPRCVRCRLLENFSAALEKVHELMV